MAVCARFLPCPCAGEEVEACVARGSAAVAAMGATQDPDDLREVEAFDLLKSIRDMLAASARSAAPPGGRRRQLAPVGTSIVRLCSTAPGASAAPCGMPAMPVVVLRLRSHSALPGWLAVAAWAIVCAGVTTRGRCRSSGSCLLCPQSASACSSAPQVGGAEGATRAAAAAAAAMCACPACLLASVQLPFSHGSLASTNT